ncbi:MAG: hypothetical protein QF911_00705 [Candidatus Thalassarchaeaceae archaeon]|jgi:tRNA(guanine-26,N2-N2) methyltransferase|nr:hypothetical protein [Candidatus Thalassarchaeaceae archaeon]
MNPPRIVVSGVAGGLEGVLHREGKTLMRLPNEAETVRQGPGSKRAGSVFYNPAMSGSRTRSVLLFRHAIEADLIGKGAIYALDGLSASGLRARRWLNELPLEMARRVSATVVDLDPNALAWAMASHEEYPPLHGGGNLESTEGDLRSVVLSSGKHWVDIDPYGSPLPFLDSAMQSMARNGVLEVSATDTAALTGSSGRPLLRRYGARVRTDCLAHDSGLRVLLSVVARTAARHDRAIVPLLSVWDSHHLRVSARVLKGIGGANSVEGSLGWRVHSPTEGEVSASMASGLHHGNSFEQLPMSCLLPISYPIGREDQRVSGPLWVGSMGDAATMTSMTMERALETCGPEEESGGPLGWGPREFEQERRRIARSVRNISEEAGVIEAHHHLVVDDLAAWLGLGAPPSPRKMVDALLKSGHAAGLAHYGRPSFRTDAPWEDIAGAARMLQPPM